MYAAPLQLMEGVSQVVPPYPNETEVSLVIETSTC